MLYYISKEGIQNSVKKCRQIRSLQARGTLGSSSQDGENVVAEGIAQVSGQVLDGSFAGNVGLDEEAEHGEHSQPSVLNLLHLKKGKLIRVLGQTQGIECTTGVQPVQILQSHTKGSISGAFAHKNLL